MPSIRPMDEDRFWRIVERSRRVLPPRKPAADRAPQCRELDRILDGLSADEVRGFAERFWLEYAKACHWDLVLAAFVLRDSYGDDAFDEFVKSLISSGRKIFYEAICSPDTALAKHAAVLKPIYNLAFGAVDSDVYERKTGEQLCSNRGFDFELSGKRYDPEDWDEIAARAPKLWKLYGHLHRPAEPERISKAKPPKRVRGK